MSQLQKRSKPDTPWAQFLLAIAAIATIAAIGTIFSFEIAMAPSTGERNQLIALLAAIALSSVAITVILRLFTPNSLTRRLLIAAISGPIVIAAALTVGSRSMFLSEHDLEFLLILLAFATVLGVGVMHTLARPLTQDLVALTDVAQRVGEGDLEVRADLERIDEVGELAAAIDKMVQRISTANQARVEAEHERSVTLASLSHDARTPLTSMRLATEALIDGVAPDPERYLRTIESDINAVETLIDDLFTIGQIEAGRYNVEPTHVDAMALIEECRTQLDPIAANKGIELIINGPSELIVLADPAKFLRVLQNVVSNAIRHSPASDEVTVDVHASERRISILDNGAGFPHEFCEEAFQPFRRTDEARERAQGGAGLGLAVSKGIIEALNGRIWAEPGPGGKVHLDLPHV